MQKTSEASEKLCIEEDMFFYKPSKNRKTLPKAYIVFCVAVVAFLYWINSSYMTIITLVFMGVGVFVHPLVPTCLYLAYSTFGVSTSSLYSFLMMGIVIIPSVSHLISLLGKRKLRINSTKAASFVFLFVVLIFSFFFGVSSNINTLILLVFVYINYIAMRTYVKNGESGILTTGLLSIGIVMIIIITLQYLSGTAKFLYGNRLVFEDSVRQLSNTIAFPLFYSFCYIISGDSSTSKKRKLITFFFMALFAFAAFILFQTYSRGVLFSLAIVCIYVLLKNFNSNQSKSVFIAFIILLSVIVIVSSGLVDVSMITHEISSGNGRLFIWAEFWKMMSKEGAIRILFGFGPGDLHRISSGTVIDGYYAHSLFLDYLFSYGVLGFVSFVTIVYKEIKSCYRSKSVYRKAVVWLAILLFLTHGISTSLLFYYLLALSASSIETAPREMNMQKHHFIS